MGNFGSISAMRKAIKENRDAAKYATTSHRKSRHSDEHRKEIYLDLPEPDPVRLAALKAEFQQARRKQNRRLLILALVLASAAVMVYFVYIQPVLFDS